MGGQVFPGDRPLQQEIDFVGMVPFGEGLLAVRKFEFSFLCKVSFGVYVHSGMIKRFSKDLPDWMTSSVFGR